MPKKIAGVRIYLAHLSRLIIAVTSKIKESCGLLVSFRRGSLNSLAALDTSAIFLRIQDEYGGTKPVSYFIPKGAKDPPAFPALDMASTWGTSARASSGVAAMIAPLAHNFLAHDWCSS